MTLRHLRIFVAVCENESVTLAAEKLNTSQPAISLAIRELESYYGISLFDRISKKLHITPSGEQFLRYARQITSAFDEMENEMKDWDSIGLMRVGSSITIGTCLLPSLVQAFSERMPKIKVAVSIDNSSILEKRVLDNELDLALIEGTAHAGAIQSIPFMRDELVLVCAKGHPLHAKGYVCLDQLPELTFILREKGSGTRELFDSTLLTHGLSIPPAWESISTGAIVSAVIRGIGVSVLPLRLVQRDIAQGSLSCIPIQGVAFERSFHIIHHKDKRLTRAAQDWIALCKNMRTSMD